METTTIAIVIMWIYAGFTTILSIKLWLNIAEERALVSFRIDMIKDKYKKEIKSLRGKIYYYKNRINELEDEIAPTRASVKSWAKFKK